MKISPERIAEIEESLRRAYQRFSDEELRWDYHTVAGKRICREELERRCAPLHGTMQRRGGPYVPGWRWRGVCDCGGAQ